MNGGKRPVLGEVAHHFVTGVVKWDDPRTWSSRAIQYRTASYTHVDLIVPAGYVNPKTGAAILAGSLLGARSDVIGDVPPGVQVRPPNYGPWSQVRILRKTVPKAVEKAVFAAALSQLGKPYDVGGILSFVTGRYPNEFNWQDEDAWFCDEYAVWCTVTGGAGPVPSLTPNRIDPGGASLFLSGAGFA